MARELAATVVVDGEVHAAGSSPAGDVAKQITNPAAWGEEPEAEPAAAKPAARKSS